MGTPNISVFICILAMSALGHFLPKFTRPDLFFGVTVDPAFRNTTEARRMLRNYRIALWSSAIAAGTLDLVMHRAGVALILCLIGICCAQVASHRSALLHAASRSTTIEVDLSAPREYIPGGLLAALLPLVVLLGLGLWAVPRVDHLPGRGQAGRRTRESRAGPVASRVRRRSRRICRAVPREFERDGEGKSKAVQPDAGGIVALLFECRSCHAA